MYLIHEMLLSPRPGRGRPMLGMREISLQRMRRGMGTAALPAGWKALSGLTSKFFLVLPVVGWAFYFGIKIALSAIVGLVMLPVETVKAIRVLKRS